MIVYQGGLQEGDGLWVRRTSCVRETRQARESLNTLYLADQNWREQKQKTSYSSPCHTHRGGASIYLAGQTTTGPLRFREPGGFHWHTGPPALPCLTIPLQKPPFCTSPLTCPYRDGGSRERKGETVRKLAYLIPHGVHVVLDDFGSLLHP